MRPADGAYGGLDPSLPTFRRLDEHFRGRFREITGPKTVLLACDCGEWACWPLPAQITVTEDIVIWDSFEQPYRRDRDYSSFGPFRFDRSQYEAALETLCLEVAVERA